MKYIVFFKRAHYNPYRSYSQNANRYAGSRSFATELDAREFATTVKEARVYYLGQKI